MSRNILSFSNDNYLYLYSACHPKESPSTVKAGKHFTYPWTVTTSAVQHGSSQAHSDLGMKGQKSPQPVTRRQKKKKTLHSKFLSTKTFSTVLPTQSVPSGHCHADTGAIPQMHKEYRSFRALIVLKIDFFLVRPSGWRQCYETQIMPLSQVP